MVTAIISSKVDEDWEWGAHPWTASVNRKPTYRNPYISSQAPVSMNIVQSWSNQEVNEMTCSSSELVNVALTSRGNMRGSTLWRFATPSPDRHPCSRQQRESSQTPFVDGLDWWVTALYIMHQTLFWPYRDVVILMSATSSKKITKTSTRSNANVGDLEKTKVNLTFLDHHYKQINILLINRRLRMVVMTSY